MDINKVVYFMISGEDKPGQMAEVTAVLMEAKVNMSGIWAFGVGLGQAQMMAIPEDVDQFKSVANDSGWSVTEGICFRLEGEDRPGALVDLLKEVASEGINLHAVDAIALDGQFGCYLWCNEESVEALEQLLGLRTPRL